MLFPDLGQYLDLFLEKVNVGIERALVVNDGLPPTYFSFQVTAYDLVQDADGETHCDPQNRPYIQARGFEPQVFPLFLEGPVRMLKNITDIPQAQNLYNRVKASALYDQKLGMYKVNAPLNALSYDIGRARAFTPGWLENESIWLHMAFAIGLHAPECASTSIGVNEKPCASHEASVFSWVRFKVSYLSTTKSWVVRH